MLRLLTIALLLSICEARGATIIAASASRADVGTAVASAAAGDTVQIPAGNVTWTNTLAFGPKALTLMGAGSNSTVITWVSPTQGFQIGPIQVTVNSGNSIRVSNMGFIAYSNAIDGIIGIYGVNPAVRVDHCMFTMANIIGSVRGIWFNDNSYGVVDHCYFLAPSNTTVAGISFRGATNNWSNPFTYGTTNAQVCETCVFDFRYKNDTAVDAYQGANYVFRYNWCTNVNVSHHGTDSGGLRSPRSYEVYGNTMSNTTVALPWMFYSRGGSGVFCSNTAVGSFTRGPAYTYYRADWANSNLVAAWGMVTGTNKIDGNRTNGFPALDMPGNGSFPPGTTWYSGATNYSAGDYEPIEGAYQWANTINGTPTVSYINPTTVTNAPNPVIQDLLKVGLNIFDTNKVGYTPLVYPHPLVTAQDDAVTCTITNASGVRYLTNAPVVLGATATSSLGTITNITFYYAATNLIGSATSSPFNVTSTSIPFGTQAITAVAKDDQGGTATSAVVYVIISKQWTLTIQASPTEGATVTATADLNGSTGGVTPFTLLYWDSTAVTLAAQAIYLDKPVSKWQQDGSDYASGGTISYSPTGTHTLAAVYSPDIQLQLRGTAVGRGTARIR